MIESILGFIIEALIALIFVGSLLAGVRVSAQDINFRHLTIDDGLFQNAVYSILKDSWGFMWFGTKNCMKRYVWRNFLVYQSDAFVDIFTHCAKHIAKDESTLWYHRNKNQRT